MSTSEPQLERQSRDWLYRWVAPVAVFAIALALRLPPFLAAPADFIASVIRPSRMLPGLGLSAKWVPTSDGKENGK